MTDREILELVAERTRELEEIRGDLTALQLANEDVFDTFSQLTEMYNNRWDAIKNLLKEVTSKDGVRVGQFSRDRMKTTMKYKPALLPKEVLVVPGVVKDVDDKRIAALVESGAINQSDVDSAMYAYSRAPSVRSDLKRITLPTLGAAK